jgi:hypothetical protein
MLAAAGKRKGKKGKRKRASPPPPCTCPPPPAAAEIHVQPPFTIEQHRAAFLANVDFGVTLFVPNAPGATFPHPWVDATCESDDTLDGVQYPFLFVSRNGPSGDERNTTVRHLLPGRYEYIVSLESQATNANEVLVLLRDASGVVVQWWGNPTKAQNGPGVWHVFDLEGATGRVVTINQSRVVLFDAAHLPETDVCPYKT